MIWRPREAGAGIIVLPVLFSEEDRVGGDIDLAQVLGQNGIVKAQAGSPQKNRQTGAPGEGK